MDENNTNTNTVDYDLLAQMDDLGIHRNEEFANDERSKRRSRFDVEPRYADPVPIQRAHEQVHRSNPRRDEPVAGAGMKNEWQQAIEDGVFDDDDAREVKGLAELDGGNAARINRALKNTHQYDMPRERRQYDPANPGYRHYRGPSQSQFFGHKHRHSEVYGDYKVSSMGGLVPPGGHTKTWAKKNTPNNPHHSSYRDTPLEAGRGCGRGVAPPALPQVGSFQQAFGQDLGRGRGRGIVQSSHQRRHTEHGFAKQPSFAPAPQHVAQAVSTAVVPVRDPDYVPPHLRKPATKPKDTDVIAEATKPKDTDVIAEAPNTATAKPTASANETFESRIVFYEEDVLIMRDEKWVVGRLEIHGLSDGRCIWVLIVEGGTITRGDIRELLETTAQLSTVHLRRTNRYDGRNLVRASTSIKCASPIKALQLTKKVNFHRTDNWASTDRNFHEFKESIGTSADVAKITGDFKSVDDSLSTVRTPGDEADVTGKAPSPEFSTNLISTEVETADVPKGSGGAWSEGGNPLAQVQSMPSIPEGVGDNEDEIAPGSGWSDVGDPPPQDLVAPMTPTKAEDDVDPDSHGTGWSDAGNSTPHHSSGGLTPIKEEDGGDRNIGEAARSDAGDFLPLNFSAALTPIKAEGGDNQSSREMGWIVVDSPPPRHEASDQPQHAEIFNQKEIESTEMLINLETHDEPGEQTNQLQELVSTKPAFSPEERKKLKMEAKEALHNIKEVTSFPIICALPHDSMCFIHSITLQEYQSMAKLAGDIFASNGSSLTAKLSALQSGISYLVSRDEFLLLSYQNQIEILVVVFYKLLRLLEKSLIVRTPDGMTLIARLSSNIHCPKEITTFNEELAAYKRQHPRNFPNAEAVMRQPRYDPDRVRQMGIESDKYLEAERASTGQTHHTSWDTLHIGLPASQGASVISPNSFAAPSQTVSFRSQNGPGALETSAESAGRVAAHDASREGNKIGDEVVRNALEIQQSAPDQATHNQPVERKVPPHLRRPADDRMVQASGVESENAKLERGITTIQDKSKQDQGSTTVQVQQAVQPQHQVAPHLRGRPAPAARKNSDSSVESVMTKLAAEVNEK